MKSLDLQIIVFQTRKKTKENILIKSSYVCLFIIKLSKIEKKQIR